MKMLHVDRLTRLLTIFACSLTISAAADPVSDYLKNVSDRFPPRVAEENLQYVYRVEREKFPDEAGAVAFEKRRDEFSKKLGEDQRASYMPPYDQLIKDLRSGTKRKYEIKVFTNNGSNFVLEKTFSSNNILKYFFGGKNVFLEKPVEKSLAILNASPGDFIELLTTFPILLSAFDLPKGQLKVFSSGERTFLDIPYLALPINQQFSFNASGQISSGNEVTREGQAILRSTFEYANSHAFMPSKIVQEQLEVGGKLIWREVFELVSTEKLPNGFKFDPKIDKTYKVLDSSATKIPSDELDLLLRQ